MYVLFYCRFRVLFIIAAVMLVYYPSYVAAQDDAPIVVDELESEDIPIPNAEELNTFDADDGIEFDTSSDNKADKVEEESLPVEVGAPDGEGSFFDANNLVPQSEMGRKGPLNVNPVTQPASKFVIVRKNTDIDEKFMRLISAERAMSLGRFDSALLMFDDLYDFNKKDARVLMGRAVSLQKVGRFDEAMQMYEELDKVEPDNVDVKVNMLGLLGTRYPSIALRRLLDLHRLNKGNVALTAQIAIAYAKTGNARLALRYLGMAASMEPNNANHLFNMAVISDRAGDEEKAVSYYEKALEVDIVHGAGRSVPRDVIYERLAQIR